MVHREIRNQKRVRKGPIRWISIPDSIERLYLFDASETNVYVCFSHILLHRSYSRAHGDLLIHVPASQALISLNGD